MATTATVTVAVPALLTTLNTALPSGVQAFEAWPGPEAAQEMVVLGEVTWDDYEIATIKTGRQRRQEDWSIGYEVFVLGRASTTPADPAAARSRAFVLNAVIEDALANDPKLGLGTAVLWVQSRLGEAGPRVFERGWAYRVAGRVHVSARLT
jgi:hypothetical protein